MKNRRNYDTQWYELVTDLMVYRDRQKCLELATKVFAPLTNVDKESLKRSAEEEIQ